MLQQGLVGVLGLALAWWLVSAGLRAAWRIALVGLLLGAVVALLRVWGRLP